MNSSQSVIQDPQKVLTQLIESSRQVDLHHDMDDGAVVYGKTRVISGDKKLLYLDQPQSIGTRWRAQPGDEVTCFFNLRREVHTFDTRVVKTGTPVRLNAKQVIVCIAVENPQQILLGQRRAAPRVKLAFDQGIEAECIAATDTDPATAAPGGQSFSCRLGNGSQGGLSLIVDSIPYDRFKLGSRIFVNFRVPVRTDDLVFLVEIRGARQLFEGTGTQLGVMFLPWPGREIFEQTRDAFNRYLDKVQGLD